MKLSPYEWAVLNGLLSIVRLLVFIWRETNKVHNVSGWDGDLGPAAVEQEYEAMLKQIAGK